MTERGRFWIGMVGLLTATLGAGFLGGAQASKRPVAADCREEVFQMPLSPADVASHQCERADQQVHRADVLDDKKATYICRCIDLHAQTVAHDTWLTFLNARVERLEQNGVAPPSASARVDTLEWKVNGLQDKIVDSKRK